MTQVKPSSFDIGRKSIPPSQPVSNLNMCYLHTPPRKIRISNIVCFLPLDLPNCNCTLHISPSLSGLSCDNFAIGYLFLIESSRINTTSPTWKFRFGQFHFWRDCRVAKTSFFHRVQNSLHTCWTRCQYLRQYIPSFCNIPGSRITIFVFMFSNCIGLSGPIHHQYYHK